QNPNVRALDLNITNAWQEFAGSSNIPYLGVAAHTDWIADNGETIAALHAASPDAAAWIQENPDQAGALIAGDSTGAESYGEIIRANARLGLNVQWATDIKDEIHSVYEVGMEIGYFETLPTDAT